MQRMMKEVLSRLERLEEKMSALDAKVCQLVLQGSSRADMNSLRRQCYRKQRIADLKGRLQLPEFPILDRRDRRLAEKVQEWAAVGIEFGKADMLPSAFVSWLVWVWNNDVYVKKPVTFSGSAFRIWNGSCRQALGPGDLMHYYRKRLRMSPFLRNEGERQDFALRPWWNWGMFVLAPVLSEMKDHEAWGSFTERFKRVQLLVGGIAETPIGNTNWDFNEDLKAINQMMRKIAPEWITLIEGCLCGLRSATCPATPKGGSQAGPEPDA